MPKIVYDDGDDVLYVTWIAGVAAKGIETLGRIKRYDAAGNLLGVTIMDFAARLHEQIVDDDMNKRASDAVR